MLLVLVVPCFGPNPEKAGIFECEALTKNASVSVGESQMFGSKAPVGSFPPFTWDSFGLSALFYSVL